MRGLSPPPSARSTETEVVGRRTGALLVDALVVFAVFYAGIKFAAGAPPVGTSIEIFGFLFWYVFSVLLFTPLIALHGFSWAWYVAALGIWTVYGTVLEATMGQTLGKRLFGIVVTDDAGRGCSLWAAAVRNALRLVDGLGFYGVGFVVLAFTPRRQRLGDLAAGTVVTEVATDPTGSESRAPDGSRG